MPAADLAWLHMDRPTNLMVVNVAMWFDGPVDRERVKELCRERLVDRFPRFRQRVVESPVPWRPAAFEDDPRFDLERHFHRVALREPGDEAALLELVADLMARPLDHGKSLWDMYLVEGYGPGCAIICRVHHCMADGVALARVLLSLTDDTTDCPAPPIPLPVPYGEHAHPHLDPHPRPRPNGRPRGVASEVGRALRRSLLAGHDTRTVLKGELGVPQRVAVTRPMRLDDVLRAAHATGTTVNDVVLSAIAGAIHGYLLERGSAADAIRVAVPLNLRSLTEPIPREMGNRFGLGLLTLPIGLQDPRERLCEVHRRMSEIKDSPEGPISFGVLTAAGAAPESIERAFIELWTAKASAVMSNVPGPPQPVYLAGTPVEGILAWAPKPGSLPMSVTIFSYNGAIRASFAVDAGLIPDPDRIVARVEEELDELERRGVAAS
jgi:WS/DGAT/MGAT family acyltransferase